MPDVTIASKPFGPVYSGLVDYAASHGGTFTLVMRPALKFKESAHSFRADVKDDLVGEGHAMEWPGTVVYEPAVVLRYALSPRSVHALKHHAFGLYDWRAPRLPEDLAFYLPNGACWLGSIAHEKDSFIHGDVVDIADVRRRVPGLHV